MIGSMQRGAKDIPQGGSHGGQLSNRKLRSDENKVGQGAERSMRS